VPSYAFLGIYVSNFRYSVWTTNSVNCEIFNKYANMARYVFLLKPKFKMWMINR
jgi:hypothetical protein